MMYGDFIDWLMPELIDWFLLRRDVKDDWCVVIVNIDTMMADVRNID